MRASRISPLKNIVIRNLTVKNGQQLVAIGSELSGGIENIFIDSCTVVDGASSIILYLQKRMNAWAVM